MSKKAMTPAEAAAMELRARERARIRMTAAARRYVMADRTDPFTAARVAAHIASGVATVFREESRDSGFKVDAGAAYYDATPYRETQEIQGYDGRMIKHHVVRYMNMVRP